MDHSHTVKDVPDSKGKPYFCTSKTSASQHMNLLWQPALHAMHAFPEPFCCNGPTLCTCKPASSNKGNAHRYCRGLKGPPTGTLM